MKKQLLILAAMICLICVANASQLTSFNPFIKKGTFSYFPELTTKWQPVKPDMCRIILYENPNKRDYKLNTATKSFEQTKDIWKVKVDLVNQLCVGFDCYVFMDVAPGKHLFVLMDESQVLETEAGKTYYLELNKPGSKEIFIVQPDEALALKTLTKQRHVFRDPLPFNEQPKNAKVLYKGNKVLKK